MIKIKDKKELKELIKKLEEAQEMTEEIIKLDSDDDMNTEGDIYGQIADVIGNIETLME